MLAHTLVCFLAYVLWKSPSRPLRLRCVTTADEHQRVFLSRLGLELPQHLRWIEEIAMEPGP